MEEDGWAAVSVYLVQTVEEQAMVFRQTQDTADRLHQPAEQGACTSGGEGTAGLLTLLGMCNQSQRNRPSLLREKPLVLSIRQTPYLAISLAEYEIPLRGHWASIYSF
jgi:hypothetical protein